MNKFGIAHDYPKYCIEHIYLKFKFIAHLKYLFV